MKFAIIREGKQPPDERVPLVPGQVRELADISPKNTFVVQASQVRRIKDHEYEKLGIEVTAEVSDADVLLGVKEVPKADLIPDKTYLFFSHTIKMQPYNKELLQTILQKRIRLIDWECLRDRRGHRLIGFGRYAGIVGAYNGFRAYGIRNNVFQLKKASECEDRVEMEAEMQKIQLPPIKILLTGRGKVAKGSMEILDNLKIPKVGIRAFLNDRFEHPVYCQITFADYFKRKDRSAFRTTDFYAHPELFESDFMRFANVADFYIAGHYWDSKSPFLFTRKDAKDEGFNIRTVADISCDIDGPVATTIRPSTIEKPFYSYDPMSEKEVELDAPGAITVMAVDNLPCELPRDASFDFGEMFMRSVYPCFTSKDREDILKNATICEGGVITEKYAYLREWVEG